MGAIAKVIGYLTLGVGFIALGVFVSFLLAYPTMWLVNYVFTAQLLAFVFGGTLTVYKAWALNILAGFLFKSTNTSSSK